MGGPGRDASENEGKGTRGFRVELRNHPIGVGSALGNQGSLDLPSYFKNRDRATDPSARLRHRGFKSLGVCFTRP